MVIDKMNAPVFDATSLLISGACLEATLTRFNEQMESLDPYEIRKRLKKKLKKIDTLQLDLLK